MTNRNHIVVSRLLPASAGNSERWCVAHVGPDGAAHLVMRDIGSAAAEYIGRRDAFTAPYPADLTVTNRTLDQVLDDPDARVGALWCPEGGAAPRDIWVRLSGLNDAGQRFHASEVGAEWRHAHNQPPAPTSLDNVAFVEEMMIRHDWSAFDRFGPISKRQYEEAEREAKNAAVLAGMLTDKEQHVRRFGTSSSHFAELYGKLPPAEWDRLWAGWQREELARLYSPEEGRGGRDPNA